MQLIVSVPDTYPIEREYVLSVILRKFLGLDYVVLYTMRPDVCISDRDRTRELIVADGLFAVAKRQWLTRESLPEEPLKALDLGHQGIDVSGIKQMPIIYGKETFSVDDSHNLSRRDNCLRLPVDIFGSAFFMLSRYEEIVNQKRDVHGRFSAVESLAYRNAFLGRPIVDEYVEVLRTAINHLWPGLIRTEKKFSIQVSHDVDSASRYGFLSAGQTIRAMAGDVILRGRIAPALLGPLIRIKSKGQIPRLDPYNTFDCIMDISERYGLISTFHFNCGEGHEKYDSRYEINHPAIRSLLSHIHKRGHKIGLHPSYNSYRNPQAIIREAAHLKKVCEEERIEQDEWGSRMHYLRWETPTTLYGLEQAGITYDSTLGYADCAGFRCGTCHEYPAFDPVEHRIIDLYIRPLIAMECTIIDRKYMALGATSKAYDEFKRLKGACRSVGGTFTLLWHNTRFVVEQERELYEAVVKSS